MSQKKNRIESSAVQRAALYIRVSTEEQAMHGLSLTAQRDTLTQYAQTNGLKVVGIYTDEGITARKKYRNRAAFMRMLEDVQADQIDIILFIKLDRWFRSVADYYEVQHILDDHHVQWIATEENYDTTTANGRLHLNIKLSIAQDESDRTSERIKFVFDNKVKRGEVISGKVPLGYKIENKKLAIDPETASIAQDIFQQYTVIRSVRALREYVLSKYGLVYGQTGIRAMLDNERYIGRAHDQDDFCPPLISPEQFQQVQELLTQRAQRNLARSDRVYLFTGLVRCAECGNSLSAHVVARKYTYYRCTKYEKLHLCPHKKRTSELVLEQWLLDHLINSFEEYNLSIKEGASITRPQVDELKIRRKMEKLKDLYLNDLIDRDTYERDYTALRDEIRAANTPPARPPKPVDIVSIQTALSAYSELSRQNKKEFWCRTVGKIIITNDDHFFVSPVRHN